MRTTRRDAAFMLAWTAADMLLAAALLTVIEPRIVPAGMVIAAFFCAVSWLIAELTYR